MRLREQLSIAGLELEAALGHLRAQQREGFILSTCARTELYGVADASLDPAPVEQLLDALGKRDVSGREMRDACYVHWNQSAVQHALRVASGIDSVVLGEDQIQAQMKRAIEHARTAGALGATLERLGAVALSCGKRVRASTGLGRHSVSIESLAIRAASERLALSGDSLANRAVLVIGAGESASLILRQLAAVGVTNVTLVSRSAERANALAVSTSAIARGAAELADCIAAADVIFCCTSAPHPVVTTSLLSQRMSTRPGAPLLCVDIGMPRDVDWTVKALPHVRVVALDELEALAAAHQAARREHIPAAEAIVDREAERFMDWLRARGMVPAISLESAHATQVVQQELSRALTRLPHVSARDREIIAQMAHRIARKLTHARIDAIKQQRQTEYHVRLVEESGAGEAS